MVRHRSDFYGGIGCPVPNAADNLVCGQCSSADKGVIGAHSWNASAAICVSRCPKGSGRGILWDSGFCFALDCLCSLRTRCLTLPSVDPGLPLREKKCVMRVILGSLLLLSTFSVDHPATRQPVATHVESIGYLDLARQTAI